MDETLCAKLWQAIKSAEDNPTKESYFIDILRLEARRMSPHSSALDRIAENSCATKEEDPYLFASRERYVINAARLLESAADTGSTEQSIAELGRHFFTEASGMIRMTSLKISETDIPRLHPEIPLETEPYPEASLAAENLARTQTRYSGGRDEIFYGLESVDHLANEYNDLSSDARREAKNIGHRSDEQTRALLRLNVIAQYHALKAIAEHDWEKLINITHDMAEYEFDNTNILLVGTIYDVLKTRVSKTTYLADDIWTMVEKELTARLANETESIELEAVTTNARRRNTSRIGWDDATKNCLIARRYDLKTEDDWQSAERDIFLSGFLSEKLGGLVPTGILRQDNEDSVTYVEKVIPGFTLEEVLKTRSWAECFPKVLRTMNIFYSTLRNHAHRKYPEGFDWSEHISGADFLKKEKMIQDCLFRFDYGQSISEKFIKRLSGSRRTEDCCTDAASLEENLNNMYRALSKEPTSIMHHDLRASNIIFRNDLDICLIDLEDACVGKPVFDMAGLIEHSRVESWRTAPETLAQEYSWLSSWRQTNLAGGYQGYIGHVAAITRIPLLIGAVLKHNRSEADWTLKDGRSKVLRYLHYAGKHCEELRDKAPQEILRSSEELRRIFAELFTSISRT